ncbi:MAG: hypothetical protein D8M59_06990 [Planctomycetes bacterium]|nr:hypothetical protein [Planctomycetota bacterium]NOG54348.1 hypothetical protein [Planctomycetota bacterium]
MALVFVFILLSLGIGLSQASSAPKSVTLRWLRLGDLIALCLVSMSLIWAFWMPREQAEVTTSPPTAAQIALLAGFIAHLLTVQMGRRVGQRVISIATCTLAMILFGVALHTDSQLGHWFGLTPPLSVGAVIVRVLALMLSGWLLGGFIMTMLLGHAYLTAGGEMTQAPFLRHHRILLAVMVVRLIQACAVGLYPWWQAVSGHLEEPAVTWQILLVINRFLVGLLVPIGLTVMSHQCARIRANQSATGILYVSGILILIGELTALSLTTGTGRVF